MSKLCSTWTGFRDPDGIFHRTMKIQRPGQFIVLSDEDYEFVNRLKPTLTGTLSYAVVCIGIGHPGADKRGFIYVHKLVFYRAHGYCPVYPQTCDHYPDRDIWNCTRENVREATRSVQSENRGKFSSMNGKVPSSPYVGVHQNWGKWRVRIQRWEIDVSFPTQLEAAFFRNKCDHEHGRPLSNPELGLPSPFVEALRELVPV